MSGSHALFIESIGSVNSLSNRTTLSLKEDLMRSPVAEALAGSMIQYFHGGCKFFGGYISKV